MSVRRKSESSEGDDRPGKRRAHGQERVSSGPHFACPFYKRDPIHNLHCLYRYQLTTPSFVRQHVRRYHNRCPDCGGRLGSENSIDRHSNTDFDSHPIKQTRPRRVRDLESRRGRSKDRREGSCGCHFKYQRSNTEDRWYDIFTTLFPGDPLPSLPYVDSPEDEIVRMAFEAVGQISPHGNRILGLENLRSWSDVSSILERASPDRGFGQTPGESTSSSLCEPIIPSILNAVLPTSTASDADASFPFTTSPSIFASAPAADEYAVPQGIEFPNTFDALVDSALVIMGNSSELHNGCYLCFDGLGQSNLELCGRETDFSASLRLGCGVNENYSWGGGAYY
ncbi:hypothetical protein B0T14DRAFT_336013 [Immersiella caudata]|uniref:C2H2-type domain-containing protein n=1 Tax=Immersiella caudata TaxID=314043 RepID=A0AA39TYH5_9PEZI|nr:hypothetical protein B0T14DRAFT_336013 [Immersiella caudata]